MAIGLVVARPNVFGGNIWDGGGGDNLWSTNANWNSDTAPGYGTLTFGGTTRPSNTNNNITSMNQLNWTGATAWTLGTTNSTTLSLFDNGGTQAKLENNTGGAGFLVTLNLPITFANTNVTNPFGEINAVTGDFTFANGGANGSGTLTVSGSQVNGIKFFGSGHTINFNNTVNASNSTNGGNGDKWFGITTGGTGNTINIGGTFNSGDFYVMNDGTLNLASGGTLNTTAVRLGGDFGNTGNQNQTKGGTFQLTSTTGGQNFGSTINTVSGNTSNNLNVNSLNTSNTNTISGSIFLDENLVVNQSSGGTLTLSGATINIKNKTLSLKGAGGNINITSAITNSVAGGQVVVGTNGTAGTGGTVTMSASNTYSGDTFVRNGTLAFSGLGNLTASTIRLGSNVNATAVDATIALAGAAGGVNLSATINPVAPAVGGSGTLTLDSQNTSGTNTYSGHIGMDRNFTINQATGGTLAITQARAASGDTTTGADIKNFTLTITGDGNVRIGPASPGSTSFGTIYNSTAGGIVRMSGNGTLFLNDNANSYSGGTIIDSGKVSVGTMGATGTGAITFNGGTLAVTDASAASSTRAFTLNSTGTLEITGGTKTFSGQFSGNGGLTKTGASVLTLSGASNNYLGSTTINEGTLRISSGDNRLPTGTNLVVNSGASVDLNAFNQTVAQLNDGIGGGGTVLNANGGLATTSTLTVTGGGTFTGNINDGASTRKTALTKSTAGTLTLGGTTANTYTGLTTVSGGELDFNKTASVNAAGGDVTVSGGTLKWLQSEQLSSTSTLTLNSGTVNLNGFNETLGSFINNGGTFMTGTGDLIGMTASVTFAGGTNTIDSGGIVEDGHIDITGGTNTVAGGATEGLLHLRSGGTGLSFTGATLTLNSDDAAPGRLLIEGNVSSVASGTTSEILSGGSATNAGNVDLGGGTRTFTIADGGVAVDMRIGAQITNGGLVKAGDGVLEVTGNNTYATGGTTVNAGTLLVNNTAGSGTGAGSVTVNATGTLGGTGTVGTDMMGTSVMVNANGTITGGTNGTVGALTLQVPSVIFTGTDGSNLATYAVDISGATSDMLAINGVLDLSNTFDQITFNGATDGSTYILATYTSVSGTFDTFMPTMPVGYQLIYGANQLELTPIPEPSTWVIGSLTLAALLVTQRRRIAALCRVRNRL